MPTNIMLSEVVPFHVDEPERFSSAVRFKGGGGSNAALEAQIARQEKEAREREAEAEAAKKAEADYRKRQVAGAGKSILSSSSGGSDSKNPKTKKSLLGAG